MLNTKYEKRTVPNSKLTIEKINAASAMVMNGYTKKSLCEVLGVNKRTFNRWLGIGKEHENSDFLDMTRYQWLCRCLYRDISNAMEFNAMTDIDNGQIYAFERGANRIDPYNIKGER